MNSFENHKRKPMRGQAIMINPVNGTLMGASDPRKDDWPSVIE